MNDSIFSNMVVSPLELMALTTGAYIIGYVTGQFVTATVFMKLMTRMRGCACEGSGESGESQEEEVSGEEDDSGEDVTGESVVEDTVSTTIETEDDSDSKKMN
jgi:hypothetical protein